MFHMKHRKEYKMKEDLTPRTQDLLDFIIKFKQTNGYSPTNKEMRQGINTKSRSHINQMLDDLEDKNYIKIKHRPRSTNIIKICKFPELDMD